MIFLSYAREDSERASRIYSLIAKPDRPVFYDKEALVPGMDWEAEIEQKLAACSLILVLCSQNSVLKEGFVQREIRLALDRAERMPDGRIFIIPVRFDGINVPRKLARFHWLEIKSDADFFELEYFVDLIWARLTESKGKSSQDTPSEIDDALLRENVTILLQGKNVYGDQIYTYLELQLWKLQQLREKMRSQEDFMPTDFGTVISAGKGEPPDEIRQRIFVEKNMVDVPRPGSTRTEKEGEFARSFLVGFTEGYKSIMGDQAEPPLLKMPDVLADHSNPMREGIRYGVRAATERVKDPPTLSAASLEAGTPTFPR